VDQQAKGLESQMSPANVRVTVDAAAERLETVIEMKRLHSVPADQVIQLAKGGPVVGKRKERIARREDMARVDANAEALRIPGQLADAGEMFEAMAQTRTLTRGRFEEDHHLTIGAAAVNFVERPGNSSQSGIDVAVGGSPRMGDKVA